MSCLAVPRIHSTLVSTPCSYGNATRTSSPSFDVGPINRLSYPNFERTETFVLGSYCCGLVPLSTKRKDDFSRTDSEIGGHTHTHVHTHTLARSFCLHTVFLWVRAVLRAMTRREFWTDRSNLTNWLSYCLTFTPALWIKSKQVGSTIFLKKKNKVHQLKYKKIGYKTQFISSAKSYMFRHQGPIIREVINN